VGARQTLETLQGLLRKEVDARVRLAAMRTQQLQSKVAVVDQELARIHEQLASAPVDLKTVDDIENDLTALRARLKDLTESRDQAMITANTSSDVNVVLLAPAGIPIPTNQLDMVRLMLAPAFSLLIGVAVAFFIDGLDLTVRTANQAEEYLDLPVLASLSERRRRSG
jgi:capsular polysaccharide biosynthesis protein